MNFPLALTLYRWGTAIIGPFAPLWLNARVKRGKEDAARVQERYGRATRPRPTGRLVWLHAASVGEAGVALQIAEALGARDPWVSFLISTGTRTSADKVAKEAGVRTRHTYAPLDRSDAVRLFLDHWKPDLGIFVESEVWPNLILEAQKRGVPLALVNARMSPNTLARWRSWPATGRIVFGAFSVALAADKRTAEVLSALRAEPAPCVGNLKLAAAPPPFSALPRAALEAQIAGRPFWLAASTHEGEDEILHLAHTKLQETEPNALLIIVPRHPERGAAMSAAFGHAPLRSRNQPISEASVYIADTMGELGLFYSITPAAFIAGSLLEHLKGHNPIEPAKLGAPIVSGPFVESFQDLFDALVEADAAAIAADPDAIAAAVAALWADPDLRTRRADAAKAVIARGGQALDITITQLLSLLPAPAEAPANATA